MPIELIWDLDPTTHTNPNTYGTEAEIKNAIQTAIGGTSPVDAASGEILVRVRCSAGGALETNRIKYDYWNCDAQNYIHFKLERSNGHPAILLENADYNGLIYTNSPYMKFSADNIGDGIFRMNTNDQSSQRTILQTRADHCFFERIVLDGQNIPSVTSIEGNNQPNVILSHCNIYGGDFEFAGAVRFGGFTMYKCTIYDCEIIRPSADITLSHTLLINSPFYSSSELNASSNYNATSQLEAELPAGLSFGANSIYGVNKDTELQADGYGGFNVLPTSPLATAGSGGGPIGSGRVLSANAPVVSASVAGDTLSLVVQTHNDINADCVPHVNGSPVASQAQTKTTGLELLTWDLTSFTEIANPQNSLYSLTIKVTDTDANEVTTQPVTYSQAVKGMIGGNSLSGVALLATSIGGSETLKDMIINMYTAHGKFIHLEESLKGNGIFEDHSSDAVFMSNVTSGNFDLILMQCEGRPNDRSLQPDPDTYYDTEAKPIIDAIRAARTDFVFYSHNEYEDSTEQKYLDEKQIQEAQSARMGVPLVPTAAAWHAIRVADPSLDMWFDNTHQNYVGAYVNCLALYRYLTGESVVNTPYQPASLKLDQYSLTDAQILLMQTKVDETVTTQFVRSTVNTCKVTITEPSTFTEYTEGDSITFRAVANDSVTGNLSADIEWTVGTDTTVLATGPEWITTTLPTGDVTVNARRLGSDGKVSQASRLIKNRSQVNAAPVATTDAVREIDHNSPWTQVRLSSYVTDDNNEIDWSTLVITEGPINAAAYAIDGTEKDVVNLDYSGTNYQGTNTLKYTVQDLDGATSNEGIVTLPVSAPSPPSASFPNNEIIRGQENTATMKNYTPATSLKATLVNGGHDLPVTLNTAGTVKINVPDNTQIPDTVASSDIQWDVYE